MGYELRHVDTDLQAAIEAYASAFRSMGFQTTVTDSPIRSVKLLTFSNGDTTLSGRFHGGMGDVAVKLQRR